MKFRDIIYGPGVAFVERSLPPEPQALIKDQLPEDEAGTRLRYLGQPSENTVSMKTRQSILDAIEAEKDRREKGGDEKKKRIDVDSSDVDSSDNKVNKQPTVAQVHTPGSNLDDDNTARRAREGDLARFSKDEAEKAENPTKSEGGKAFRASDYAYVPDPQKPSRLIRFLIMCAHGTSLGFSVTAAFGARRSIAWAGGSGGFGLPWYSSSKREKEWPNS